MAASLSELAARVLEEPDPNRKAILTEHAAVEWHSGRLELLPPAGRPLPLCPVRPARPAYVAIVEPSKLSNRSLRARVHALAHAEAWAIDLSWDIIVRFGFRRGIDESAEATMPRAFYDDWVQVALEEAHHFRSWASRLEELGTHYGALPGHDGASRARQMLAIR